MIEEFRTRVASHIWMWMLIFVGVFLDFILVPRVPLFVPGETYNLTVLIIVGAFLAYHFSSALYWRTHSTLSSSGMVRMIQRNIYGKAVHPTCTTLVIIGWLGFFLVPDIRIFIADAWATAVVWLWIKTEENSVVGKPADSSSEDIAP